MDEEQLIGLLIEKNEVAFRLLIDQYESSVYNTVIGFLRSDEFADDVAQEVFITVFESIRSFRRESTLATWIYRIAVSKSLEFIRKQKRKKRFGILYSLFGDDVAPRFEKVSYDHPGVALENKEMSEALFIAIDKLPQSQRTAFVLHNIDGMSYEEASQVMGTTVSSIESLIHRATVNLRKYLTDYYKNL